MIDLEYLREQLDYNPETGKFFWRISRSGVRAIGSEAGCKSSRTGYVLIGVGGRLYLAHRLAWLMATGKWPDRNIDHINRNKSDNRIANLRQADQQQNIANSPARICSKSGVKGVSWCKSTQMWRATITVNGKQRTLGRYAGIEDAAAAYQQEAIRAFGEFAYAKQPNEVEPCTA